jgi:hypothetical protein
MGIIERLDHRLRPILVLAIVLVLALAACGSSASAPVAAPAGPTGGGTEQGGQPGGLQGVPSAAPSAAPASGDGQGSLSGNNGNPPSAPRDSLRIVYTGSLQLVVADLPTALARGQAAVDAVGGYIGASQESNDGDKAVATISYRIPAERWETVIGQLRGLATKVVAEQTQATEVGGQIVDLEARIRNLRASESALVDIAKGTGKISDLLQVEAQLSDVRGQIEQLDAQRAQLVDQVSYGTLVTTFGLEIVAVQEQAKGWDPAQDVDGATATLISVGQGVVSVGIWLGIVWLPLILVLIVLAVIARWLFRRFAPKPRPHDPIPGWGGGAAG